MNSRIEGFRQQAMVEVDQSFVNSDGKVVVPYSEKQLDISKFAELIVKECAELVAGYYDERTDQWAGPQIKEYFGVNE